MTVILVSHSMEDIARYADRIIVMNKGSVMHNDKPKKVFAHYQELEKVGLAAPQVTYIMHDLKAVSYTHLGADRLSSAFCFRMLCVVGFQTDSAGSRYQSV